ncbi:hypothetical protein [Curtobacterium sp. Arg-1]|uniref:hypothetical protein n=1 Tax=Curtobacterium sp. Arg-1 TaxID=2935040 RepID=UPI0021DB3D52|nr:hypothetical protein [Curtobacterium sp. Arg-1]UXZ57066.1 hypothetical protein MXD64_13810 [Curtobacterium sp. Arg-1]
MSKRIEPALQLGQHVQFSHTLKRLREKREDTRTGSSRNVSGYAQWRFWRPQAAAVDNGVIVGKRTLSNGWYENGGYEDPAYLHSIDFFPVYLVAFDMNQNPAYVLPEHITAEEASV